MAKKVGILTAGSDCPGLNAAIRGFGKAARATYRHETGWVQGRFPRPLVSDHRSNLSGDALSNILTAGGTILGTSRDVPMAMEIDGKTADRVEEAVAVYRANQLDALVCIGGRGNPENCLAPAAGRFESADPFRNPLTMTSR